MQRPGLAILASSLVLAPWLAAPAPALAADADRSDAGDLSTVVVEGERISGPLVSDTGTADYRVSPQDLNALPQGDQTPITDVLTQLPSVAADQNLLNHTGNTE